MVFGYKYITFSLVLLQCCTSMAYGVNIDCNGKAFHCLNATHFKICVDLGGGVSKTVDDFLLPCPDNTFCMPTNQYECEYHEITSTTTASTTTKSSAFSARNDISKVSIIPLLSTKKKSETTTAATVRDDAEYKVSLIEDIFTQPSTISVLKSIENTSKTSIFKIIIDEKRTSAVTLSEPHPTESFLESVDKSLEFNDIKNKKDVTDDLVINKKIEHSSVISDAPNNISNKNVTLNESSKDNKVKNIKHVNNSKFTDPENIFNETILSEKDVENITSNSSKNVFNTNHSSVLQQNVHEETSENIFKDAILNVSTNPASDKDLKKVNETTSLDPIISDSISISSEKSIKGDKITVNETSIEANTSSVVNIVLNKISDNNGKETKMYPISKPLLTAKNSLGVHNSSYDLNTKLNISGSEKLNPKTVPLHEIIDILVTTTPANNEINYLQAATDININDVELLENAMNTSSYPNIFINGSNLSFDTENQTMVNNTSAIHKLLKLPQFKEESNAANTESTTESLEFIITTMSAGLREETKIKTNNTSNFTNINKFFIEQNETKDISDTTEIINVISTTEKSGNITNNNTNNKTHSEESKSYILNNTTDPSEVKTPKTKSEIFNENYIKILPSISELQITTEENEVLKTYTNNFNQEDFIGDLRQELIQTETMKNNYENRTNYNVTKFTGEAGNNISNSIVLPESISDTLSISNFENNTTDASTDKTFDSEINSHDVKSTTASSISYSYSLHATMNTDTVSDLIEELPIPNQKQSKSTIFTFASTTESYNTDASYAPYIDYNDTNNNDSTTYYSSFEYTTTESYKEGNLRAELTSSINNTKPLSDLLYSSRTNALYTPQKHNNKSNIEASNITTTSRIFHTSTLLTTTERYEATTIVLDTSPKNILEHKNINGNKWLDSSSLIAVKNNTVNATNTLSGISIKMAYSNDNNTVSNVNAAYNASSTLSSFITTTDYNTISNTTDNGNQNLPTVTNFPVEKEHLTTNDFKTQNYTPISQNLQDRLGTETIPNVLNNTLIKLNETQTDQIYFSENYGDINRDFLSIQIDYKINNATTPDNSFQNHFSDVVNVTLIRFNETQTQIHQKELDKQKVIMNASEADKPLLSSNYTIRLLSKGNITLLLDEKLNATDENLKPVRLDTKIEQNILTYTGIDNISHSNDFTTNTLINVTEEYKSTPPLVTKTKINNIGSTIIDINTTTETKTKSVPVPIEKISTMSKESQLKQTFSTTESLQPITKDIKDANRNYTQHNTTLKNYELLKKDLTLNSTKKDETINAFIFSRDKNYTIPNNVSALFEGAPEILSTITTSLPHLLGSNLMAKTPINASQEVSVTTNNNLTTNFINKLVTNFYSRTSESKLQINSPNNYMKSDTPLHLQITKQTQLSKSKTALLGDIKFTSDILDPLESTTSYQYSTNAYSPELKFKNNSKSSDPKLIYRISENKQGQLNKLSGIAFHNQSSTTRPIKAMNTVNDYLLTQVPAPVLILTSKTQNSVVQNVTKSNSHNISESIVIQNKDSLNSITTVDSKHYSPGVIYNLTENKPVSNEEKTFLNQLNASKKNTSSSQLTSINNNQNKTQNSGINSDNTSVTNLTKSTTPRSILVIPTESSVYLHTFKTMTATTTNNNSTNKLVKSTSPQSILVIPTESSVSSPIFKNITATTANYGSNLNDSNVKNKPNILLEAKSSYSDQSKNYNQTLKFTTKNNIKADNTRTNKCLNQPNGKYADKDDCKKFYLCLGDAMPVSGECPHGTVFSESKKQCTKNLSQCYRNNQFTCLSPGRYYDLSIKNVYYICVKNRGKFIKFKYQCQNGYNLNETIVKCIKDPDTSVQNNSESNTKEDSTSISVESSSRALETSKNKSQKEDIEFECKKEGEFPHPKKCHQYYFCSKISKSVFRKKLKTCESGEVFDKEKQKCVDNDSQECK